MASLDSTKGDRDTKKSLHEEIHEENTKRMAAMSAEEIAEAQVTYLPSAPGSGVDYR